MRRACFWFVLLAIAPSLVYSGGCDSRLKRERSVPSALVDRHERERGLHSKAVEVPSLRLADCVHIDHKPLIDKKDKSWRRIPSVEFSPDNRYIITSSNDVVRFWRIGDFQEQFHVAKSPCPSLWFSPDGQSFLSASDAQTLCLRSTVDGRIVKQLPPLHEKIVDFSRFSLDGKTVVLLALKPHLFWTIPPYYE